MIEVEEESEVMDMPEVNQRVKLMTQGQWMKGCPEGGEQSFLFSLYSQLCEGKCLCPHGCGTSIDRQKSDFFAIYVSPRLSAHEHVNLMVMCSPSSPHTSNSYEILSG